MKRFLDKLAEVGFANCMKGTFRRGYYRRLQKKYQFESWHLSPYELREYAQKTAEYVSSKQADLVVDIGCGLGEIIRHIQAKRRIGIDIQQEVVLAAKFLDKTKEIEFRKGSGSELGSHQVIDYLITLGFMHGSNEDVWRPIYHKMIQENQIKHIIVDTLPAREDSYLLDFSKILPESFMLEEQMGSFLAGRFVLVYKNTACV